MIFFKNKKIVYFIIFLFASVLFAENSQSNADNYSKKQLSMKLTASDVFIVQENNETLYGSKGFHLYIKKIKNVRSVLLTETTKDPTGKEDSFAYRAPSYNSINGDEIRYLNGKPLVSEGAKYSLIDSTPENHPEYGPVFHIFIPETILFGYEWTRHGEIQINSGTFINIRTFEKPYADYDGEYMDSPFMFNLEVKRRAKPKPKEPEKPEEPEKEEPEVLDGYNPVANEKFKEISSHVIYSKGPETIVDDIADLLHKEDELDASDLVFAIDATGSMKNDIEKLKKDLIPRMQLELINNPDVRIGLLFYRDYGDSFSYKGLPVCFYGFTTNLAAVNKNLNSIKIYGREGGDIPEAVYEAIYAAVEYYDWRKAAKKRIILIGDAEPHPEPRVTKKYSKDYVMSLAENKSIEVTAILLPAD